MKNTPTGRKACRRGCSLRYETWPKPGLFVYLFDDTAQKSITTARLSNAADERLDKSDVQVIL